MLEAIILVGGLGTRLKSVSGNLPKALVPVQGKPFLCRILEQLAKEAFSRIILATGYKGELIQAAIGHNYAGMEIVYSHEDEPLGTGGALAQAMRHAFADHLLILNGDTWLETDYSKIVDLAGDHKLVFAAKYQTDTARYGRLIVAANRIIGMQEKSTKMPGFVNTGFYGVHISLLDLFPKLKIFSFEKDFIEKYLKTNEAYLHEVNGEFWDIGIPDTYRMFNNYIGTYECHNIGY